MKLNLSFLMVCATASAFAPSATFFRPAISVSMVDSSEAVKAAMEASEKFGKQSKEASAAWDIVEEMDASNSHVTVAEKKDTDKSKPAVAEPVAPIVHEDTSEAVSNALEASKLYGAQSKEARIAWDIVEELDAANSRHSAADIHVMKVALTPTVVEKKDTAGPSVTPTATNAEEAIASALLVSKIYGRSSSEAKVAWDLVEEMDESRSRHSSGDIHVKAEEKPLVVETPKEERKVVFKDTSDAIKTALQASKEFGKTSTEARLAWELVEEIDATNAHHKTVGSG